MRSNIVAIHAIIITLLFVTACTTINQHNENSIYPETIQPEEQEMIQIEEQDIASIQSLMDKGHLTSKQLTEYYLNRISEIDQTGPTLNAMLEVNPDAIQIAEKLDKERQEQGPRGLLHGIPVVLKANIDTGDQLTTTAGSLALSGHQAQQDAFLVARLRDAGMIILGKANLSEWANFRGVSTSSGWSSEGGQTKNPYFLDRNPCGSSSGSAVAVTANLTMVSVGTETDGSIVCPASTVGIVGLKPTLGLISRAGIIPIAHSMDTAGPMARTVKDATLLLSALVAQDITDPASQTFPKPVPDYMASLGGDDLHGIRLGVLRDYHGAGVHADLETTLEQSITVLESLGAEIIDPIAFEDLQKLYSAKFEVMLYEFHTGINHYLKEHDSPNGMENLEDLIAYNLAHPEETMPYFGQELFLEAVKKGDLTDKAYQDALALSQKVAQDTIDTAIKDHKLDAIIAPTNRPAWVIDWSTGDNLSQLVSSSTLPAVAGYPNITVPMGQSQGLPLGLSFFGTAYSEPTLLRIAYNFEQETNARNIPNYIATLDSQ